MMARRSKKQLLRNYDLKLAALQKEKMHFQMTGQYLAAQKTFQKIERLKCSVTDASTTTMKSKQCKQLTSMKAQQSAIFAKFESDWKRRMKLFDAKCYHKSISALQSTHELELSEFHNELQHKLNRRNIKFPPKVLQARDKELALARLNKFGEAFDVQQHRLALESECLCAYRRELQKHYVRVISNKQSEHTKTEGSLRKRLDNSRAELDREYEKQRQLLLKRQRTLLGNLAGSQKRRGHAMQAQNQQKLARTYVGTHHGHNGTVSTVRPWTFRVNETKNLSPRKTNASSDDGAAEQFRCPNADIAEIEQFIVAEYKKENASPMDAQPNLSATFGERQSQLSKGKGKRRKKGKKKLKLNAGAAVFDHGNRLTNLIEEINEMKLFAQKPQLEMGHSAADDESIDIDDIDIDDIDIDSKMSEEESGPMIH